MLRKIKISEELIRSASKKRLFIWAISIIGFYFFSYSIDPFSLYWDSFTKMNPRDLIIDIICSFLFGIIIAEMSLFIDRFLNGRLLWTEYPLKRLIIQAFLQILGSIAFVLLFNLLFLNTFEKILITDKYHEFTWLAQWISTNIVVSLLITAINTGHVLLNNLKRTASEAAQLKLTALQHKQSAMAAELQSLKLQIDPHFIFNNLSVLSELILKDQQLGYEYSENFAKVYRYLLINSKKDMIMLEEELKFLDSYIFLTKKRIGEGVNFDIDVDEKLFDSLIPPLTVQFLVENAIKHNQTTKANPLSIKIFTTDDRYLIIQNSLLPLLTSNTASSGMGIKNIIDRFELLSQRKPIINKTQNEFIAKIPLL